MIRTDGQLVVTVRNASEPVFSRKQKDSLHFIMLKSWTILQLCRAIRQCVIAGRQCSSVIAAKVTHLRTRSIHIRGQRGAIGLVPSHVDSISTTHFTKQRPADNRAYSYLLRVSTDFTQSPLAVKTSQNEGSTLQRGLRRCTSFWYSACICI